MKQSYITPYLREVAFMPEALLETVSTNNAYGEDPDERGPQSSRGFDWEPNDADQNFWTD